MTTSGGLGEAEVGGPALNIVPKTGGNSIKGSFYASGVTKGMIGSNYTQDLKDRGLTTPGTNTKIWDFNLGVGGPIVQRPDVVLRTRSATKAAIGRCPACSRT